VASLAETYAIMHAVLRGEQPAEEAAPLLGVDPHRLAIYQGFVRDHVTGILTSQFPRVEAAMPAAAWSAVQHGFFETHPPTDWELNEAAAPFPDYLAGQLGLVDGLALFHLSLAQFERAQWGAYSDPATIPHPGDLDRPVVNPTLRILELPCPVVDQVVVFDRGDGFTEPPPDASDGPERVLFFRHPERLTSAYWRVTERFVLALATTQEGHTPEEAAAAFGCRAEDVLDALSRAAETGLCIVPT